MKSKVYFVALCVFVLSCSTTKNMSYDKIIGKFYGKHPGFSKGTYTHYNLELKQDSTFYFQINGHDYSPECKGMWSLSNDILLLKCDEEKDVAVLLSSGYMNQREYKVIIKNRNKLKLDTVVLKRKQ